MIVPGEYIFELEASRPVQIPMLKEILKQTGFSPIEIIHTDEVDEMHCTGRLQCMGKLNNPIQISSIEGLRWLLIHKLNTNDLPISSKNEFELEENQLYELRFISSNQQLPTKIDVVEAIEKLGFKRILMMILRKNVKIPGCNFGTNTTEWIALVNWTKEKQSIRKDEISAIFIENVEVPK